MVLRCLRIMISYHSFFSFINSGQECIVVDGRIYR
jgi:hypothetical protein